MWHCILVLIRVENLHLNCTDKGSHLQYQSQNKKVPIQRKRGCQARMPNYPLSCYDIQLCQKWQGNKQPAGGIFCSPLVGCLSTFEYSRIYTNYIAEEGQRMGQAGKWEIRSAVCDKHLIHPFLPRNTCYSPKHPLSSLSMIHFAVNFPTPAAPPSTTAMCAASLAVSNSVPGSMQRGSAFALLQSSDTSMLFNCPPAHYAYNVCLM